MQIRAIAEETLVLLPEQATAGAVPAIDWHRDGPARYRVEVTGATEPFVLALADAWSADWQVQGLPAGATARQLKIDGYRNGWVISGVTDAHLTLTYAPARYGRDAMHVSQVTAALLVGTCFVGSLRRRRPRKQVVRRPRSTGRRRGSRSIPYPEDWLVSDPSA